LRTCLDTSAILKLKREPKLLSTTLGEDDQLFTTTITVYELLVGANFYGKKEKEFVDKILSSLNIVGVEDYFHLASKVAADLLKEGKRVNDLDTMIAASCLINNLRLVTADEDFNKIKSVLPALEVSSI
jgi:predicted nucleic acid-binding protein